MAGPGMPMQMNPMQYQQVQQSQVPMNMQQPLGPPQGQQVQHQQAPVPHPVPPQGPPQQPHPPMDPVTKFKNMIPRLREALVNLFKTGAHLFYQNARQDETGVQMDNVNGRFEKCLEEFYATCDQLEMTLRLAHEIVQQDRDSSRNTPHPAVAPKTDASGVNLEGASYCQYLSTVRAQIGCAKEIRDLLHDCLKNFPEMQHS